MTRMIKWPLASQAQPAEDGADFDPISWEVARRVAETMASRQPQLASFEQRALETDFVELTTRAEQLVEEETGLRSLAGPARARVTDRPGWVGANIGSFQRLLKPLAAKIARNLETDRFGMRMPVGISRTVSGGQVGLLLGWMSTRVLGQYDQLLVEDDRPEDQDIVYYVGPNIVSIEKRYGFPPREFRLWLALHEVTHRAQFTGVPWMRDHFVSLVGDTLEGIDPDPKRLLEALKRSVSDLRAGSNPLSEGGLVTLLASPDQYRALQRIGGLMSLLEGHGDITMDRAAVDLIPNAPRFGRVLKARRRQSGIAKVLASLIGLDAKLRQYEEGEKFIRRVETAVGRDAFAKVWEGPAWLPSWPEIRQPELWIDRTRSQLALD